MHPLARNAAFLAALVLLATPPSARAQAAPAAPPRRPLLFGVSAGPAFPLGYFKDVSKVGYTVGALIGTFVGPTGLRVQADVQYSYSAVDHAKAPAGIAGPFRIAGVLGSAAYEFPTGGSVAPYVIGGAGVYWLGTAFGPAGGTAAARQTRFGVAGGAGIRFNVHRVGLSIETRLNSVASTGKATTFLPVVVGVGF